MSLRAYFRRNRRKPSAMRGKRVHWLVRDETNDMKPACQLTGMKITQEHVDLAHKTDEDTILCNFCQINVMNIQLRYKPSWATP